MYVVAIYVLMINDYMMLHIKYDYMMLHQMLSYDYMLKMIHDVAHTNDKL